MKSNAAPTPIGKPINNALSSGYFITYPVKYIFYKLV